MGNVNLFANSVTDNLVAFLAGYQNGALRPVLGIRLVDDRAHPHVSLSMTDLPRDYIVFEVPAPIERRDIGWLYNKLIVEALPRIERKATLEYAFGRCGAAKIQKQGGNLQTKQAAQERLLENVRVFRKTLETPSLALRHFRATCATITDHLVDVIDGFVVIEYTCKEPTI